MPLGKTTLVRWFSLAAIAALGIAVSAPAVTPPPSALAALVRPYRESPTPARRAAIDAYATAHSRETAGSLAHLAMGVVDYEQKNYPSAIANLKALPSKLPQIADYAGYYLAAARVESGDFAGVGADLAAAHRAEMPSPLSGKAWILEARALQSTDAAQAVRLLRDHYSELLQPVGDLTLADSYLAAGDMMRAADFYQRVYYEYISGDAAGRAAAALAMLKETMGAGYPQPLPRQMLRRADRYLDAHEYREARGEYQMLASQLTGVERDLARVRGGEADYLGGNAATACTYLRGLDLSVSEADAERLYYQTECARKLGDDEGMLAAVKRLEAYRQSPWRMKALVSAGNRFLLDNRPDDFIPLYKTVYEEFPSDAAAGTAHWKVTFQAYLAGHSDAAALLREHLRKYPKHATAGAALYFLGRIAEAESDTATARTFYQRLDKAFTNTYYGMLARRRLEAPELREPQSALNAEQFLATLALPEAKPVSLEPATAAANARIGRSRLLRSAGLNDLADGELRFGARDGEQPVVLAVEMATAAEASYQGLRIMKSLASEYLNLPLAGAPRQFWELLFPLPYREALVASARARGLDPYLLAGLIRQESEFNPEALSHKNAYGLTQVEAATGRRYARQAGVARFNKRVLFQPATNLKIGATIFQSMLDENGGKLEETLASYNAGPNRLASWLMWRTYREPAEFVESIPFTETREYVQAVLRNADVYRRLYLR